MEAAASGAVVGAAIKVVLQNLLSYPVEDIGLLWNFNKDLKKLKQSVVTIQNFLDDAEMKQVTDKSVQCWLQKLESLAYDADYVFDELNYQVLRKKVETDNNLMRKKVSSFFSSSNPIAFHYKMAQKVNHIKKELKLINQEASELGLQMRFVGADARGARTEAPTQFESDSFTSDRIFVGRENDVRKIVEMVTSSSIHEKLISTLAIIGMGGLGKTTLARKVYNDHNIVSHFENRIWVYVSENFVPETVFKSVAASLAGEDVNGSREIVLRRLQEKIENKRYLLVLDNVWNEDIEKWENFIASFEGISPAKGNVIIVTTRSRNVASIVKTLGVHELRGLHDEDCWSIIKAKAFGEGVPSSEFEIKGKNIARRCKGLPLAANVVGGFLRGKSKDEWISVEKNLLLNFGGEENSVSKILKLSFDNLRSPSLKKCFAYCSILPKGSRILKVNVIALWMAEGFLQTESKTDMEIVGNKVFNILVQSSLLQIWEKDCYGNVISCCMHDLVHDLASSVLNPKFVNNTYQVRYMSRTFEDNSPPIAKEHAECLRGLFLHSKVPHVVLSNLKRLHVLILMGETIEELPNEIGKLISLRCLDISHTRIKFLPNSIGDLYHLQTLRANIYIRGYFIKLPDTFTYLISLRHLYIPNIKMPVGIGKLKSLQTLPFFQVGDEKGCGIMELGSLKNLRGEIEIHNLNKVRDKEEAKSADLPHKTNLFKLKLVWNESGEGERTNDENVLEGLEPHPNLKVLEIHGFKGRSFPLWTLRMAVRKDLDDRWVRLDNLLEVKLSGCKECQEVPMLGHLPNLMSLCLHSLTNVKSLGSSFYGIEENGVHKEKFVLFPALVKLELIHMANLTGWEEIKCEVVSVFRHLKDLKIINCRRLMNAPSHFPCLKELLIDNMESGLALANICGSKLTSLTKLIILKVDGLVCLPDGLFHTNRGLLELEIINCNNFRHLVPCLGGGGASLRKLRIQNCGNFIGFLDDLEELLCCPSGDGHVQGFTSLCYLQIMECSGLTNLPCEMLEACAPSLEELLLRGTQSLTNLPQLISILHKMPRLRRLLIQSVPKLGDVAAEIGSLHSLEAFGMGGSSDWDYVTFKESLNRIFPAFQSLHQLQLIGMEDWDALPDQLQHLTTLRWLLLWHFGIQLLPEWLENLSLTNLSLDDCRKLRRLPSKKAMQGLTTLTISRCPALIKDNSEWSKISHIPNIIVDNRRISPSARYM